MTVVPIWLGVTLLVGQDAGSIRPQPDQQASYETLSLCTALIVWNMDHPPEGEYLEKGSSVRVDFERAETISASTAKSMLVPKYVEKVLGRDPWTHPYQLLKNVDPKQPWSWAVRSAGPDGEFCGDSYLVAQPDGDKCDDIVRVDGVLVAGPERLEDE